MEDINTLKEQIRELMEWKAERQRQQITYPLDINSILILNKYLLTIIDVIAVTSATGRDAVSIIVKQDNNTYSLAIDNPVKFTVDTVTNIITAISGNYINGNQVNFATDNTLPSPLSSVESYYIINSSGISFKVSSIEGTFSITTAPLSGDTALTLNDAWTFTTGTYLILFGITVGNGAVEIKSATFTHNSTSVTWSGGLANSYTLALIDVGSTAIDITTAGTGNNYIVNS